MQERKRYVRSHYLIDLGFQTKFIIKFCILIVIASVLIGILIYYFNRQTTTVAFENLKVVVKSTADFILPIMLQILIAVTVLVGISAVAVTLFASHKIAGPLYRLKMELERMKSGDFSYPIHVRSKDQLQKLATEFEEMRIGLKNSVMALRETWLSVKTHLEKLKTKVDDENEKRRINDDIKRIDTELAKFKTE